METLLGMEDRGKAAAAVVVGRLMVKLKMSRRWKYDRAGTGHDCLVMRRLGTHL